MMMVGINVVAAEGKEPSGCVDDLDERCARTRESRILPRF